MIQNRASAVRRSKLAIVAAGASLIIMFALASSAFAVEHHPKGEYASFADCPLSNPATELCIFAKTESGEFTIGKETVPIMTAVTLQGGIHNNGIVHEFIGAEDGNPLSKTPQKVPGGLAGLVKCNEISNFLERIACEVTFENGLTEVNATTELAAPASSIQINLVNLVNLGTRTGTALQLPVKVHLENPFLGSNCTVGSNSNPIIIPLTTGTTSPAPPNNPISGSPGEISLNEAVTIVTVKNNVLVNNSFAAPEATGYGGIFSFLIDPLIDSKLLPSAAGHNTAILRGTLKDGSPKR